MLEGQLLTLGFLATALLDQCSFILPLDLHMAEKLHHLVLESAE